MKAEGSVDLEEWVVCSEFAHRSLQLAANEPVPTAQRIHNPMRLVTL